MQTRTLGKALQYRNLALAPVESAIHDGPPKNKNEISALLQAAVERGIMFFDMA